MRYRILGLHPAQFDAIRHQPDDVLAATHAERHVADAPDAYPCRISLRDAQPGDSLILMNHEHLPVNSPYRSRHAIYINEQSLEQARVDNRVPAQLQRRLLSVRGFDAGNMILDDEVVDGKALEAEIARQLSNPAIAFLHVHFARRGCYAARVERLD
ncbi:MAG: DUF1203 domain-containing protein [Betaproteobacteria bacterium]|nr:DUF1203 domain-containing protein [Betaproteobacteria bacterium]